MPFRFFRRFNIGGLKIGVGKRGVTSIGVGRITKSGGRTTRVSIPTGIPGLSFWFGGKRKRRRR